MLKGIIREISFLKSVWLMNLASAMEYRFNFIIQIVFMFINNAIYFVFWLLFFEHFESIKGWSMTEMYLLFATVTTGFGIALTIFGNATRLNNMITMGQMDTYLSFPRPVMLYALISRSSVAALGDISFGVIAFLFAKKFTWQAVVLWMGCSVLVALIFVAFCSLVGSLAFWLGKSNVLAEQANMVLLTFSMYPNGIFDGFVRLLLFTIVPAGLIGAFPVEIVRDLNGDLFVKLAIYALIICVVSVMVFYFGLRRYESSNVINVNS